MKRILSMMIVVLMVMSLTACGTSGGEVQKPDHTTTNETPQPEASEKMEVTIEEMVLVDRDEVKITAKTLNVNGENGAEFTYEMVNNSDKTLLISSHGITINNQMIDGGSSAAVNKDDPQTMTIVFKTADLEALGIETIADIGIAFQIADAVTLEECVDLPKVHIATSAMGSIEYPTEDSGTAFYNENKVKLIVKGWAEGGSDTIDQSVIVCIENNGDKDITVKISDAAINEIAVKSAFSAKVAAGESLIENIVFEAINPEEIGYTLINAADVTFQIFGSTEEDVIADAIAAHIPF